MNKRIIGKAFLIPLFFCISIYAEPSFQVRLLDGNGNALEQVAAGQPFILEVAVVNAPRTMSQPVISDIDRYNGYCSGVQITSVNGKANNTYTYVLRIDTSGNYQIGPITTLYDGKKKEIDALTVLVGAETKQHHTVAKVVQATKTHYNASLKLTLEKERVFVGEPIQVKLRFSYNSPHIVLRNIAEPTLKYVSIDRVLAPIIGKQMSNGNEYEYAEWEWRLYATKEGIITLPAYGAQYEIVNPNSGQQSGMNFFMFFQPNPIKAVYSNAATLVVDPVPDYNGAPVNGVGQFSAFRAEVNPAVVKVGQAAVVTFALVGKAHFAAIEQPVLQDIPSGCRWYASRQWVEQGSDDTSVKYFEYVLHACQVGDWEIPSQVFTFFDPENRQYGQLESNPQTLTIVGDSLFESATTIASSSSTGISCDNVQNTDASDVCSDEVLEEQSVYSVSLADAPLHMMGVGVGMPWWLFFFFVLVPFSLALLKAFLRGNMYAQFARLFQKKYAFYWAKRRIRIAQYNNRPEDIYSIFCMLCSHRLSMSFVEITHDFLENVVALQLPHNYRSEWKNFIHQLASFSYTEKDTSNDMVWREALIWLRRLQEGGL